MQSKLEKEKIIEKIRGLGYESKLAFIDLLKYRISCLREHNDTAHIDEIYLNQGGIRELNELIRKIEYIEKD
jgi:hypothetical protein